MRFWRLLAAVVIGLSLVPALRVRAERPAQVWVDDDYCLSCPNDGHAWGSNAFSTLSVALRNVARGGTVYVLPGRYHEDVRVEQPCRIVAVGNGRAIVTSVQSDAAVTIVANDVTVQGLEIIANHQAGILVLGPAFQREPIRGIVVRENAVRGGYLGVAVNINSARSGKRVPTVSAEISNLSSPWEYGALRAAGVEISDNTVSGCKRAIYVYNTEATISGNTVSGLAADGIGIYSSQDSVSSIRANTVRIDVPNGRGIYILENEGTAVEGNRLTGTAEAITLTTAVGLYGYSDLFINDNTIDGFYSGLVAYTGGSARICRNSFDNSLGPALQLGTAITTTQVTIEDNLFRGSYQGARLDDEAGYGLYAVVRGNAFYDNVTGIQLAASIKKDQVYINANTICGNLVAGLRNESTAAVDATGNWWGASDGPGPAGSGDRIEGPGGAIVEPWLRLQAFSRSQPDGKVTVTASLANSLCGLRGQSLTFRTDRGTFVESGSRDRIVVTDWRGEAQATLGLLGGGPANVTVSGICRQIVTLSIPASQPRRVDNVLNLRPGR